jgi:hypothetical protein
MSRKPASLSLSETEGFVHIARYYQSGLSPSEYCRKHDISGYLFYNWRKRYLDTHPELSEANAKVYHYPYEVKVVFPAGSGLTVEPFREWFAPIWGETS